MASAFSWADDLVMTLELQLTACCVIDLEEAGATLDELLPIAQVKNCALSSSSEL
jgi:hypothetical protein